MTFKFIEPNISVSYDSNYFKLSQRYSNTFYETEAYDFRYQLDTANKVTIHLKADHASEYPPLSIVDNHMLSGLKELKTVETDSFKVVSIDEVQDTFRVFLWLALLDTTKSTSNTER